MQPYTTKSGLKQFKPALSWIENVIKKDTNMGFCLACGKTRPNCEPDARKYDCEKCHKPKVYGAEELLMMGLFHDGPVKPKVGKPSSVTVDGTHVATSRHIDLTKP